MFHPTNCDSCHQPQWEASVFYYLVPIQNRPVKVAVGEDPRDEKSGVGLGSEEQVRVGEEPRDVVGVGGGASDKSLVFMRAINREGRVAMRVHGCRIGGDGNSGGSVC